MADVPVTPLLGRCRLRVGKAQPRQARYRRDELASPAGGQGMNIGIQDAVHLGRSLVAVLREDAAPATLDGYEAERRPVAERVVRQTDRLTRMPTLEGPVRRGPRNWAIEVIGHLPGIRRRIASQFAELDD